MALGGGLLGLQFWAGFSGDMLFALWIVKGLRKVVNKKLEKVTWINRALLVATSSSQTMVVRPDFLKAI